MDFIHKQLADHLRNVSQAGGIGLKASHAHELVAAFFGYRTKAALDADIDNFLSALEEAWLIIPNVARMDERRNDLKGLSCDLPSSQKLAEQLVERLDEEGILAQKCFRSDLEEYLTEEYLPSESSFLYDDLSGIMAETNAIFDEEIYNSVEISESEDKLVFRIDATINGQTLEDKVFSGDQIDAQITLTTYRLAGRSLYGEPEFEASGGVNWAWAEPDDYEFAS